MKKKVSRKFILNVLTNTSIFLAPTIVVSCSTKSNSKNKKYEDSMRFKEENKKYEDLHTQVIEYLKNNLSESKYAYLKEELVIILSDVEFKKSKSINHRDLQKIVLILKNSFDNIKNKKEKISVAIDKYIKVRQDIKSFIDFLERANTLSGEQLALNLNELLNSNIISKYDIKDIESLTSKLKNSLSKAKNDIKI